MRLLILSFYYEPDLSAGSFRATALVRALRRRMGPGSSIDVLTTLPNRYRTFSQDAPEVHREEGLEIRRVALPAHNSDMLGQSRAFLAFARHALDHVSTRHYDLVFATSSRLMTAVLGAKIARKKRAPLYLDIRDIFAETISDLMPSSVAWATERVFSWLEKRTIREAKRVNLVSPGFEGYFGPRYPGSSFAYFTNGIDDEFLQEGVPAIRDRAALPVILYAGNMGEGQGLHEIVPGLARALHGRARIVVIGDGGRRAALEAAVSGLDNVELCKPITRDRLLEAYRAADVLFLHLGDYAAFERVLPSKVFEYAALGKPILAGVAGYAARFVRDEISNAAVFSPCNVAEGVRAYESLRIVDETRPDFVQKFARRTIAGQMAEDLLDTARGDTGSSR